MEGMAFSIRKMIGDCGINDNYRRLFRGQKSIMIVTTLLIKQKNQNKTKSPPQSDSESEPTSPY